MLSFRLLICTALLITSARARANDDGVMMKSHDVRHDELNGDSLDIPNEAPKLKTSLSRQTDATKYSYVMAASGENARNASEILEVGYACDGASPCTTSIVSVTSVCKFPMNESRFGFTLGLAALGGERKIFGCGGIQATGCYVLDSQQGWTALPLRLPTALDKSASWGPPASPSNLFIFGGFDVATSGTTDTVYLLNTVDSSLTLVPSLKLPSRDNGMAIVGWSDTIAYLFAGQSVTKGIWRFDSDGPTIEEVATTERVHFSGCGSKVDYTGEPEIAIVGNVRAGVTEFFKPSDNTVRTGPNALPEKCNGCVCIPLGNTFAVATAPQQLYLFNTPDESWVLNTEGGFSFEVNFAAELPLYDTDLGYGTCPCI